MRLTLAGRQIGRLAHLTPKKCTVIMYVQSRGAEPMHDSPPDQSTGGRSLRGNLPKPVWIGIDQEAMDVAGRSTGERSIAGSER